MRPTHAPNAIRRHRLLHDPQLTQRNLALCVRVLQTLISRYELGRATPSLLRAFQLAIVLQVPVEKLFPALYEEAGNRLALDRLPRLPVDISVARVWMNGGKQVDKAVDKWAARTVVPPSQTLPPPGA